MNTNKIKVLSLFDGISTGYMVLKRRFSRHDIEYHSWEIDENAISVSKYNFHNDIIRHGNVIGEDWSQFKDVDIMFSASPCTDLSISKRDREGLNGPESSLFWEFVEALNIVKPKYFLMENTASMSKKDKQFITDALGVEPVLIDSSFISGQSRKRLYWTNIDIDTDLINGLSCNTPSLYYELDDDKDWRTDRLHSLCITCSFRFHDRLEKYFTKYNRQHVFYKFKGVIEYDEYVKEYGTRDVCIVKDGQLTLYDDDTGRTFKTRLSDGTYHSRGLRLSEIERLQGFPTGYVGNVLRKTPGIQVLGNAWQADTIDFILRNVNLYE